MSFWPLSKLTVKSSRPRFSRCETSVPGVARRTIPPRNTMVRAERQRVPGTSDMAVSFLRSGCSEGAQVEARPFEGSAEPHAALVHHADDGRDHLGLRAGVLGDRIHEIEERDVRCHRCTLRRRVDASSMPGAGQGCEGAGPGRSWWAGRLASSVRCVPMVRDAARVRPRGEPVVIGTQAADVAMWY